MKVADKRVRRILIDTGSSSDIISFECLQKLKYNDDDLVPCHNPIIGFGGGIIQPVGVVTLTLRLGRENICRHMRVRFLVVKNMTAYNVIIGRPTLNASKSVVVTHLMLMKFISDNGKVGTIYGDQQVARECYLTTIQPLAGGKDNDVPETSNQGASKQRKSGEVLLVHGTHQEMMAIHGLFASISRPEPGGQQEDFAINLTSPERTVKVGDAMSDKLGQEVKDLLREYKDVFAFSAVEMTWLDPKIAQHNLNVDPTIKPVKQKKRNLGPVRSKAADEEVKKLLDAGFIRPCQHPEWVANVVLVPKPNGAWRMCVDYTDLNKACPIDSFPLSKIDKLVDSTAGYEAMSFVDAYSGFHQIPLKEEDQDKTAFATDNGLYCYKVMPFGLRNAPVTF